MATLLVLSRVTDPDGLSLPPSVELTPAMRLASRLFVSPKSTLGWEPVPPLKLASPDYLALKWGAILEGYEVAPDHLYEGRFPVLSSLQQLSGHDDPEVVEYSIWSLWKSDKYGLSDLAIPMDSIRGLPENIRRWAYRLLTKRQRDLIPHLDLVQEVAIYDDGPRSTEGLALGLRHIRAPEIPSIVLEWYQRDPSDAIRHPLIEHMAGNNDLSTDYSIEVERVFAASIGNTQLRNKILAAAQDTPLYRSLKATELRERVAAEVVTLSLFEPHAMGILMPKNTVTIQGNHNAVAGVGGNVTGSVVAAIDNSTNVNESEKDYLKQVLDFIEAQDLRQSEKQSVVTAVDAVAKSPTKENKNGLLAVLKNLASTASSIPVIVEGAQKLIEIGTSVFQ